MPNTKPNSGKPLKRKTNASAAAAESPAATSVTDDRAVRQRTDQQHHAGETETTAAAAPAASSSSSTRLVSSFLRLAVVERQLVMQGLDLISLARLASTCKQIRAEALDKEAGKFIPKPRREEPLETLCLLHKRRSAHCSPLFRMHAPMTLRCTGQIASLANVLLLHQARQFSRVVEFCVDDSVWPEEQMLWLLALPCMQHVTGLDFSASSRWVDKPLVQTAVFGLPRLDSLRMAVGPNTVLLPSAVATASKLATLRMEVSGGMFPDGSLRALHSAPSLASLSFDFDNPEFPRELVWCLPPTLTHLGLWNVHIPRDVSRSLVKALVSRTPLLSSLHLAFVSVEATLRGLLHAGATALPSLHSVEFGCVTPDDFSVGIDPDPLEPIFRRFLRHFPSTTVRIEFLEEYWEDPEELRVVQTRYAGWPTVEMYWMDTRVGGPLRSHPSDDDTGSDVEELEDPLAAEEHKCSDAAESP